MKCIQSIIFILSLSLSSCVTHEDFYSENLKKGMTPVYIDTMLTSYFGIYTLDSIGSRVAIKKTDYEFSNVKVELLKNGQVIISKLPVLSMASKKRFSVDGTVNGIFNYKFANNSNDNETSISVDYKSEIEKKQYLRLEFEIRIIQKNKYLVFVSDEIPSAIVFEKTGT